MRNKIITIILITVVHFRGYSQGSILSASEKALTKLKNSSLQVVLGEMSENMDTCIKGSFNKFWHFCPIEYVTTKNMDKERPAISIAHYKVRQLMRYSFTQLFFLNTIWISYVCEFDDLRSYEKCLGIDKTEEDIKCRMDILVLNLNAQFKFLDSSYANGFKLLQMMRWEGFKDRLKTTTILIPTEYIANGLTKNAFSRIPKKEFVSLKDIDTRLSEKKGKGYSLLTQYVSVSGGRFNIIDLETGDFIYFDGFDMAFHGGLSGKEERVNDSDMMKFIKKMYK